MSVPQPPGSPGTGHVTSHDERWRRAARRRIGVTLAVRRAEAAAGDRRSATPDDAYALSSEPAV
ncbi:hypothetical protein ACI2K4_10900 [Micromonospora sp. NPDC050397]|uniref:hypothetical protein n=1 Tax=Micromonospora sp. NPDC050397 TaxID=3364279 RepID=UPI003850ADA2